MLTETDAIKEALARSRPFFDPATKDTALLGELIVIGADTKAAIERRNTDDEGRRREVRERLVRRVRAGDAFDREAALGVHETGWARLRDE